MPRVSVIIPTYNRRGYVQEAIDGMRLHTRTNCETSVTDGASSGKGIGPKALSDEKIRYHERENQPESVARSS